MDTPLAERMRPKTLDEFVGQEHLVGKGRFIRRMLESGNVTAIAKETKKLYGRSTILFVDEIHRFSKSQQDGFLPHVEDGTIILIGATTENPGFEVIAPLVSRSQVYVLYALTDEEI